MEANNVQKMRDALTKLVAYLVKEVRRTAKCKRCKFNGKSFRGEPCYWHVDCGIEDYDKKASDNAMYLLKEFKLQEALSASLRNCDANRCTKGAGQPKRKGVRRRARKRKSLELKKKFENAETGQDEV